MRVCKVRHKVKGKEYVNIKASFPMREGLKILELGQEWELEDIDPKGFLIFKRKNATSITNAVAIDPLVGVRMHVSREEYRRFRAVLRARGLTVCHAISAYVRAVNECEDRLGESPLIQVLSIFEGVPRSRREKTVVRGVSLDKFREKE